MSDGSLPPLPVRIEYKPKINSSGRLADGRILLYIAGRIPQREQERHIRALSEKLQSRAEGLLRLPIPEPADDTLPRTVDNDRELEYLADRVNDGFYRFEFSKIRFRRQHARWGSCSLATRSIYVSDRLMGGPAELVRYVVVHEICHLAHPDHGSAFWKLVAVACNEYRLRRRQLEAYDLRVGLGLPLE